MFGGRCEKVADECTTEQVAGENQTNFLLRYEDYSVIEDSQY